MPSFRAFPFPLAMASLVILSSSLLEIVDAQSTQAQSSLTAKIELQTAALNTLEAKVKIQANSLSNMEAVLKRLESNAEIQATELKDLVTKGDWQAPVPLHSTSRTIVAREGQDVEIWCVVRGTPTPEIRWTRQNDSLESDRMVVENNGKYLRIMNVRSSDEGTYVCVAANGVGTPASQSVRLRMYYPAEQCHRIIEADRGILEIVTFSTGCLWIIKLQNTTGFLLELDPLMMESILVIPEPSPSSSEVQSIQIRGSKNASHMFEGKSLAIVVPPGHERSTISWTGLALDDSGVSFNIKFVNDSEGMLEWESRLDGTGKIFWALDLKMRAELNWTLNTAFAAQDENSSCENVSFFVLQIRPDGDISEIMKTCDGSSEETSLDLEIPCQVLILLHIKSVESARPKLRVSWTRQDDPLEKYVDGIVAGTYRDGAIVIAFNSTQRKTLYEACSGVAFDWNSGKIYYLEDDVGIRRSNLDGTGSEILVSDPSSNLRGLTIEPTSVNLYYGNRSSGSIRVCGADANKCSTIVTSSDLSRVYDFAVHRSKGLLFWSIENQNKLFRANLDGSNATILLERSVRGLQVDEQEDRLYWASYFGIGSCDMNGRNIRMVPGVTTNNWGLAMDRDNIYYSTSSDRSIRRVSKSGRNSRLVKQLKYYAWHIDLIGTRVSNAPWNPCKRSKCAHVCVLVTRWSFRCTCPDTQQLDVDGKTCKS